MAPAWFALPACAPDRAPHLSCPGARSSWSSPIRRAPSSTHGTAAPSVVAISAFMFVVVNGLAFWLVDRARSVSHHCEWTGAHSARRARLPPAAAAGPRGRRHRRGRSIGWPRWLKTRCRLSARRAKAETRLEKRPRDGRASSNRKWTRTAPDRVRSCTMEFASPSRRSSSLAQVIADSRAPGRRHWRRREADLGRSRAPSTTTCAASPRLLSPPRSPSSMLQSRCSMLKPGDETGSAVIRRWTCSRAARTLLSDLGLQALRSPSSSRGQAEGLINAFADALGIEA